MAEPPERPNPDRYDVLRSLEKDNSEKLQPEKQKTETAQQQSTVGRSAVDHWPQSPDMASQQLRGAIPAAKKARQISEARETTAAQTTKPQTNEHQELKAKADALQKKLEEVNMDGKTGDAKGAAATNESRPKDQIAREELAHSIAAEKKKDDQQQQRTNTKGKERGDD